MDRSTTSEEDRDEVSIVGLLKPLWHHRRLLVVTTFMMTALAVLLCAVHFWRQPARWTASLEFRPTFEGAEAGEYPNGLPFGPSDIIDASVIDQVYDANKIKDFCDPNAFQTAFFVEQQLGALGDLDVRCSVELEGAHTALSAQQLVAGEPQPRLDGRAGGAVGFTHQKRWLRRETTGPHARDQHLPGRYDRPAGCVFGARRRE